MSSTSSSTTADVSSDESTPLVTTSVDGSPRRRISRMISDIMRMEESPMRVREVVTEHIEERQNDWAHSLPVTAVDLAWHAIIVSSVLVVLIISRDETAPWTVRSWFGIYAIRYLLHMYCAFMLYMRNRHTRSSNGSPSVSRPDLVGSDNPSSPAANEDNARSIERLNSQTIYIAIFSVIWWLIGYGVFTDYSSSTSTLLEDAPILYWFLLGLLCLDFAFVLVAALFLCLKEFLFTVIAMVFLPFIIAILYVIAIIEAITNCTRSEVDTRDIERLPTFVLRTNDESDEHSSEIRESFWGIMVECDVDNPEAQNLLVDNSECTICLSAYEDGSKLRQLPCLHLFHSRCIDKWLYVNPICPLCRHYIVDKEEEIDEQQIGEEHA